MTYDRNSLIAAIEAGVKQRYFFFWGHKPDPEGEITKSCLSQFWMVDFTVDGITYKSAEHWMMAGKARVFGDDEMLQEIIASQTPLEAKKLGRAVRNFDPEIWNAHRIDIVITGNQHKFSQNPDLKDFLLNTKGQVLVEASPRDRIWGIGMGAKNENAQNPTKWRGQNLLGFALMKVRDEFQNG